MFPPHGAAKAVIIVNCSTVVRALAAILFHFMSNLTAELANVTDRTNLYSTLLWIVAAIVVVGFWGPRTLTRNAIR